MRKLKLTKDKTILDKLSKAAQAVEDYSVAHPQAFTEKQHKEFRKLLTNRAAALSEATGVKIHSLFDDK